MEDINKMFPHIAGYEPIKEECAQAADILSNTEEYTKRGAYVPRGWLFYGPSGVGKTRIIKDIADYLKIPVIEISISDAINNDITIDEDLKRQRKRVDVFFLSMSWIKLPGISVMNIPTKQI